MGISLCACFASYDHVGGDNLTREDCREGERGGGGLGGDRWRGRVGSGSVVGGSCFFWLAGRHQVFRIWPSLGHPGPKNNFPEVTFQQARWDAAKKFSLGPRQCSHQELGLMGGGVDLARVRSEHMLQRPHLKHVLERLFTQSIENKLVLPGLTNGCFCQRVLSEHLSTKECACRPWF